MFYYQNEEKAGEVANDILETVQTYGESRTFQTPIHTVETLVDPNICESRKGNE